MLKKIVASLTCVSSKSFKPLKAMIEYTELIPSENVARDSKPLLTRRDYRFPGFVIAGNFETRAWLMIVIKVRPSKYRISDNSNINISESKIPATVIDNTEHHNFAIKIR